MDWKFFWTGPNRGGEEQPNRPGGWAADIITRIVKGDVKKLAFAPFVMRPVQAGWCRLLEVQRDLTLTELLLLNLELDDRDDASSGIDSAGHLQGGHQPT